MERAKGPDANKCVLADSQPKPRKCLGLGCDRTFLSKGPANRICPACTRAFQGKTLSKAETDGKAEM